MGSDHCSDEVRTPVEALPPHPRGSCMKPVPGSRTPSRTRWRRLLVALLAPMLALTATSASAQGVWLALPSMPTARPNGAGAAAPCPDGLRNPCVYAIGGTGSAGTENRLEAYSPATNPWAFLPSLPTATAGAAAAA